MNLGITDNKIDLNTDEGDELLTAIIISLFTDARATDEEWEEVRDWEESRRGYWGDQLTPDGKSGSKLWLLKRSPRDDETREKAKNYAEEALKWLRTDGLVESVDVVVTWINDDLMIQVNIDRLKKTLNLKYTR